MAVCQFAVWQLAKASMGPMWCQPPHISEVVSAAVPQGGRAATPAPGAEREGDAGGWSWIGRAWPPRSHVPIQVAKKPTPISGEFCPGSKGQTGSPRKGRHRQK